MKPQVWENRESRVSLGVNDITKWGFMSPLQQWGGGRLKEEMLRVVAIVFIYRMCMYTSILHMHALRGAMEGKVKGGGGNELKCLQGGGRGGGEIMYVFKSFKKKKKKTFLEILVSLTILV